jgi:amino acid transporter
VVVTILVLLFAGGITILNLRGIRYTAPANEVMLVFMFGVVISLIVLATKYLAARHGRREFGRAHLTRHGTGR